MTKVKSSIGSLRTQIAALQGERQSLASIGRSREEVEAAVSAQVDAWEHAATAALRRSLVSLSQREPFNVLDVSVKAIDSYGNGTADLGPALALLMGAGALKSRLHAQLDAAPEARPKAEREARIREINSELDELEAQEEALIYASELEGKPLAERRADARPEIVVGERDRAFKRDPSRSLVTTVYDPQRRALRSPYVGSRRP